MNYHNLPVLSGVYLEDSYVLGIHEAGDKLIFKLDVVLRESHPFYSQPLAGERYCYRRAKLCFSDISYIKWIHKSLIKFSDATGENDYGNIDIFFRDGDLWLLEGDWGELELKCLSIDLLFLD